MSKSLRFCVADLRVTSDETELRMRPESPLEERFYSGPVSGSQTVMVLPPGADKGELSLSPLNICGAHSLHPYYAKQHFKQCSK